MGEKRRLESEPPSGGLYGVNCRLNGGGQRELRQAVVAHLFNKITHTAQAVTLVNGRSTALTLRE
jgi:hypothetical protein